MGDAENTVGDIKTFRKKAWIATGILLLTIIILMLLKALFFVLLLLLAASLIALFFNGLGSIIHNHTKIPQGFSLALAILISVLIVVLFSWFIGARVQQQFVELSDSLPSSVEVAKEKLNQSTTGKKVVKFLSSDKAVSKIRSISGTVISKIFNGAGYLYVIIFISMFFAVSPKSYRDGVISLIPPKGKSTARDLINSIGTELTKWIKGKLFAMLVVFILTAAALLTLGIPMPLALALLAGLLNFVPNFGPVIAMIPAVLVSLPLGNNIALIVAGVYILIQVLESNFITPLVQKKLVEIEPALIITGQVVMGILTGILGVLLATPVIIIIMKTVQRLYINKQDQA